MNSPKYNLTPEEQIRLVNGGSFFGSAGVPEKGVPRMQLLDGGTGMNFEQLFGDIISHSGRTDITEEAKRNVIEYYYEPEKLVTDEELALYDWITEKLSERFPDMIAPGCYPPGILLGATWDPETVYEVGEALGMEASAYGVHILLGTPNVNLHRDIRGGRLFEGYSEDPCLVSALAPELVKGVQAKGVAANVKHFAANNQETNRMNVNEIISERALRELYYPGFKACVEAGVATVMSAYNRINGVPCSENHALLHDLLREEWGFEGLVMSDWGAVYHPAAAVNAGNDLAMPGPIGPEALTAALADGSLHPDALALSADRVADTACRYGTAAHSTFSLERTDAAAYRAAAEGTVLLKNNGILPLQADSRIALYGECAAQLLTCGEGSAGIHTNRNVLLTDALSARFAGVRLQNLEDADTLVYVYTLPGQEGRDRTEIGLTASVKAEWDMLLAEADCRSMKKILVLNVSSPVALEGYEERFDGIFCIFLPGMQGANALADCLCGALNPSGKLPLTWPARAEDMPAFGHFPGDGMEVLYGEGIYVGYRWYDARKITPLFPFGHGLSYTDFSIESITAPETFSNEPVEVTVCVRNTGSCAGKTVVQLYLSDPESSLAKPIRELKAFRKIYLEAGENREITFVLPAHAFESYDPNLHAWTLEEGRYVLTAGFSSADLQASCTLYADVCSPYTYGANTSNLIIMENDALRSLVADFFEKEGCSWTLMLTSYEYTAQDTLGLILDRAGCAEEKREPLYAAMRAVRKG